MSDNFKPDRFSRWADSLVTSCRRLGGLQRLSQRLAVVKILFLLLGFDRVFCVVHPVA